jgi:protein-L-isoaspartate(D-aspartate) O-methyltransferase
MRAEDLKVLREHMVAEISADAARVRELTGKSRLDERVMAAIAKVPRHEFVPIELQPLAYANMPLPIGCEKTISQPFIVALMTDLLDISAEDVVLEIGTGLGYQAAILGALARKVYSMEIIEELGTQAKQRLHRLGFTNIETRMGNGYHGWSEHAPFDKIMLTAAPDLIPPPLLHQLKSGAKWSCLPGCRTRSSFCWCKRTRAEKWGRRRFWPCGSRSWRKPSRADATRKEAPDPRGDTASRSPD